MKLSLQELVILLKPDNIFNSNYLIETWKALNCRK